MSYPDKLKYLVYYAMCLVLGSFNVCLY